MALTAAGCEVNDPDEQVGLRCAGVQGAAIVALSEASVSGSVTILGDASNALFANDGVTLSGSVYVEADIVSGGAVVQNGGSMDLRGEVVEGADRISAEPDLEGAERAAAANDNDQLRLGGKSPIKDGELRLSGKSVLDMPAGTYLFENGMSVSGQAEIVLSGDVTIYVDGPVSITGTSTSGGSEFRLEIISVGTDAIRVAGTSEAHLEVYAPLADVALSGTTAFDGTILGNNVRISGTADLGNTGDALRTPTDCTDPDDTGSGDPDAPDEPLPDQQS